MRLAGAQMLPIMLSGVVLTHLHSDHVCDLNDVITTHWVMSGAPTPLRIVGPIGTTAFVEATLAAMALDIRYRLAHHEDLAEGPVLDVHEVVPGDVFTVGAQTLRAGATDHRPVEPTLAYRIEDGGHSVVIAGDGVPCDELDELLRGADAYVQTVIRDDVVKLVPSARLQDILDYHSTVAQAASTARRAGVKALVMTHYVPAPTVNGEQEWRDLAGDFDGLVVVGDDLTSLDLATMTVR